MEDYKTGYLKALDRIVDLEAKLAESEKLIFAYQNIIRQKPETATEMCEFVQPYERKLGKQELEINQLKQQLAEKDAEIRVAYSFRKQKCDNLQKALAEKEEEFMQVVKDWKSLVESRNQDKISFAVEQLEKVKEYAEKVEGMEFDIDYVINEIDNQIASLKKGVE